MKKTSLLLIIPIALVALLYSCSKKIGITNLPYSQYNVSASNGQLKINLAFAYTVDYATIMIKVNGQTVGSALQTRTPYPGGGYNTRGSNYALYLGVPQGSDTISISLPKVGTNTDSVLFYKTVINLPDSSPYTLHITDTLANTKSVLVKNIINALDTGKCRFRFVNLIPNQAAVDLYLNGVLIKANVPYLVPTDTFTVNTGLNAPGYTPTGSTTWSIRAAGAAPTATAIASYVSSSTLQSQSVITIFSMGYVGALTTRLPFLSFTLDKNR